MNNENEFLSWDGGFTAEESQFTLLPEGEYPFTVTNLERKIYQGSSQKIPNGAPYAEVSLKVDGGQAGTTTVIERLYLLKSMQWKLTEFFASIGQNPVNGQPFMPNWNAVIGSTGTADVTVRSYTGRDNEEHKSNGIKHFKKPNTTPTTPQQGGFTPGAF